MPSQTQNRDKKKRKLWSSVSLSCALSLSPINLPPIHLADDFIPRSKHKHTAKLQRPDSAIISPEPREARGKWKRTLAVLSFLSVSVALLAARQHVMSIPHALIRLNTNAFISLTSTNLTRGIWELPRLSRSAVAQHCSLARLRTSLRLLVSSLSLPPGLAVVVNPPASQLLSPPPAQASLRSLLWTSRTGGASGAAP